MKKLTLWLLTTFLAMALPFAASASSAMDAFLAFSGENNLHLIEADTDEVMDEIMKGTFAIVAEDLETARQMAPALSRLAEITSLELLEYANANGYAKEQVRNAYYLALANVLRAEIMANPASETRYQNIQMILDLFLNGEKQDEVVSETRRVIRQSMTPEHATTIAADYKLPAGFVEFLIMDDDWDNNDWTDDTDWIAEGGYAGTDDYIATDDYLGTEEYNTTDNYVDTNDFDVSPEDIIASADSPDLNDSADNSVDSPDYSSSADTTDYDNTVDSPDYDNSVDSPDYTNSVDSPDYDHSPDTPDAPVVSQPSPDSPDTPDAPVVNQPSPDSPDTPDAPVVSQPSPDSPDTPDAPVVSQPSPDSPDTPDAPVVSQPSPDSPDTPDYEASYDESYDDSDD